MKTMKKGFTLIELIVVIAIIAILALILVPQVTGYIADANESSGKANAKSCYTTSMALYSSKQAGLTSGTVVVSEQCTITDSVPATFVGALYLGVTEPKKATYKKDATATAYTYDGDSNSFE